MDPKEKNPDPQTAQTNHQEYFNQLANYIQFRESLERISPDGLVTFSVRGKKWEIPRTTITRWTGEERKNWFAFNLAEHADAKGKKTNEPIFINRNSMAFDYIIALLSGENVDFSLLTPDIGQQLIDDIQVYQMEKIADKHLKNQYKIPIRSRKVKLIESAGKILYLTSGEELRIQDLGLATEDLVVTKIVTDCSFDGYDVIIINAFKEIGVTNEILGKMLADFVDKGGNVVFFLHSNTTNHIRAEGNFKEYNPFKLRGLVANATADWMGSFDRDHPLMKGVKVNDIRQTGDLRKVHGELNSGDVEVVARWSDGSNMIAIRHERKGLITSIGFNTGLSFSEGDITKLVLNAIQLRKSE